MYKSQQDTDDDAVLQADAAERVETLIKQQQDAEKRQAMMADEKERAAHEKRELVQMMAKEKLDYIARKK